MVGAEQATTYYLNQRWPCLLTHHSVRITLQWRHNGRDGVSNHQPNACLIKRLFGRRSKKTSKLRITGLCVGNYIAGKNAFRFPDCVTLYFIHHDDVIKWTHFPRYWPFMRGIHRSPVNSPQKGKWRGALMFFFDLRLNKQLSKQSLGWWFETPSRSLWRHCNALGQ